VTSIGETTGGGRGWPRARRLLAAYWRSEDRRAAYWLLAGVASTTLVATGSAVVFSFWMAEFFNALQKKDVAKLTSLIAPALAVFATIAVVNIIETKLRMLLQIRWREWLTRAALGRYTAARAYFDLGYGDFGADNPDQRIADDLRVIATDTVQFGTELLSASTRLLSFVVILWTVGGALEFELAGTKIVIPGYMVFVAVLYTALTTWLGHLIARRLAPVNFEQQRREADFRVSLVRLRENAEPVAMLDGGDNERRRLAGAFAAVRENFLLIIRYMQRLHGYQSVNGLVVGVFPFIAGAPRFLSGGVELGGFMQMAGAFQAVHGSLNWFLSAYERLAVWKASLDRVVLLEIALDEAHSSRAARERTGYGVALESFEARDVSTTLPDGTPLGRAIDLQLAPGERVLLTGPSGIGKSALFRTLAGVLLPGAGSIRRPVDGVMFLPQKPYLPVGTLRAALAYPADAMHDEARTKSLLERVGLDAFAERLDEAAAWHLVLSAGEQQRLAAIRAVLARPRWLFLDEATSALDADSESRVYAMLDREMPSATIVSIAHRDSLRGWHTRHLHLDRIGLHDMNDASTAHG
jgi:putative ATP-binding cassette transporter